uniref:J domain-containing protein n=1 Tax=Kalanchoe fedtschenkoi TaxID=63787 RepID=A0A7N0ZVI0_KALFE
MQRWRNALNLRFSLGQKLLPASNSALFHSTPSSSQKRRTKWDDFRSSGNHTKNHIRFQIRQKRADSKKALRDLVDKGGFPNFTTEDCYSRRNFERVSDWDGEPEDHSNSSSKQAKHNRHNRSSDKARKQRLRRKLRNEDSDDEYDGPSDRIFYATFGGKKFTWSFNSWNDSFSFEDMDDFYWKGDRTNSNHNRKEWRWNKNYESQPNDESRETYSIGSTSDRTLLGLSPRGPLKIEEVKVAFRQSALKWHPDKHEGPSKVKSCHHTIYPL